MRKILTFMMANDEAVFNDKIRCIKGLRALTGLGLREAKEFVEEVQANKKVTIAMNITDASESANEAIKLLANGGIVVLDSDGESRKMILDEIKILASKSVEASQYDIARQLISILETTIV